MENRAIMACEVNAVKEIISVKNEQIKSIKKLHKKKYRDQEKCYLIEGFHLVEEAVKAEVKIRAIYITKRGQLEWGEWVAAQALEQTYFVSDEVMKAMSELPTPQGILAVAHKSEQQLPTNFIGGWLLLDNVQDPGNVGTMIRTADAAGLTGVILGQGSADLYNSKVLRAMQGSNYHIDVLEAELGEVIGLMKNQGMAVYGTELNPEAISYKELPLTSEFAFVMGNEGQGVASELLEMVTQTVYIPIKGQAESLNVAIAAAILMYHFVQ